MLRMLVLPAMALNGNRAFLKERGCYLEGVEGRPGDGKLNIL